MQQRDTKLLQSSPVRYQVRYTKVFSIWSSSVEEQESNPLTRDRKRSRSCGSSAKFCQLDDFNIEIEPHERQQYQDWNTRENKK